MKSSVRAMARAALMTAAVCLTSVFSFPAGTVAVTLQTFAVALAGYMLGPREAVFSVLAYLLTGACGLPVFSGFRGGVGVLLGPTGGFLWSFPVMAELCSLGRRRGVWGRMAAGLAGLAIMYGLGVFWLACVTGMGMREAFLAGAAPFLIKDVLSVAGASAAGRAFEKRVRLVR